MAELFDFMVFADSEWMFRLYGALASKQLKNCDDALFMISYDHPHLGFSNYSFPSWPSRDSPFAADDPCATHELVAVNS